MMLCFEGVFADPVFWGVSAVSAIAACVMIWMVKFQSFQGKTFYALTFVAMIWTLIMVGLESASSTFSCQIRWATLAWLGNSLVPIAWCFFVFAYVENASWLKKRRTSAALIVIPIAIFAFAATNQWHNLVYTSGSIIPQGEERINYDHGAGFYVIILTLYSFVFSALVCLARAFKRAKRCAWPLLTMFAVITATPLTANAAYVGLGFTVAGLDPTAFMFTVGILAFTWLLVTSKTMDMASVGQSILFNTMSEPVVLIDRHRNIVLMNTAAKRSALLGEAECILTQVLENIDRWNTSEDVGHFTVGKRSYEPRIQEIESPLDPSEAILGWSVTFVDITDRLALFSALEEALEKADHANRAKDDFISVVSHELRTPLTSLKGGLDLALSGSLGELSGGIRSSLEIAHRNGVRLSRLVDNILLAQKIDIDALSLDRQPVDLKKLLNESFEENKMFASKRRLELVDKCSDQAAFVMGDAFAIRQIVDNLVSNAIKFSEETGVVEGVISCSEIGRVKLSIRDTGQGIPDGMEKVVFGRFEQVKDSGQSPIKGSGLGLHISEKLAKQLSGRLYYESQLGVGTTFHLEFPTADPHALKPAQMAG